MAPSESTGRPLGAAFEGTSSRATVFNRRTFPNDMGHGHRLTEHHAARFLMLLDSAGEPSPRAGCTKVIYGTIKFAKLDFLLRYPEYLYQAVKIVAPDIVKQWDDVDHLPMSKYKMGPFEREFYDVISHLESRGLVRVTKANSTNAREFHLTAQGSGAVKELLREPLLKEYHAVGCVIRDHFGKWGGSELRDFIYEHFPSVGDAGLNESIKVELQPHD